MGILFGVLAILRAGDAHEALDEAEGEVVGRGAAVTGKVMGYCAVVIGTIATLFYGYILLGGD